MMVAGVAYGIGLDHYQWFPYRLVVQAFQQAHNQQPFRLTPGDIQHFKSRTEFFRQTVGRADIIMLGDSITERAGDWRELFPDLDIKNRGIDGDTTLGVLYRLDEVLSRHPRVVALLIGINDVRMALEPETVISNVKEILRRLKKGGARPIMQSTLLPAARMNEQNTAAAVFRINAVLKEWSASQNIEFLDLNAVLAPAGALDEAFTTDGIHLRYAGYRIWGVALDPVLRRGRADDRRAP
jgi:lysophospholipase L1-like esterase